MTNPVSAVSAEEALKLLRQEMVDLVAALHSFDPLRAKLQKSLDATVNIAPAAIAGDAHEIWAAAQLAPGEGIEGGVARIVAILDRAPAAIGTTPLVATEAIQNAFDDEHHRACSRDEFYAAMLTA